ncbi:hypothetical protein [Dryocola sp. BD626]|uniref:hypothetical protein n=1 Tax=Dryocola sp. BD626 TaxID=3133273 RepID=UPI003F4F79E0
MKEGLTIGQLAEINAELNVKVSALLKERDALVAENAALKVSEKELDDACQDMCDGEWESIFTETPATDAALADIEARGVEKFISRIEWIVRNECNPGVTERLLVSLSEFAAENKKEGSHAA